MSKINKVQKTQNTTAKKYTKWGTFLARFSLWGLEYLLEEKSGNEIGKTRRLRISNASYAARTHSSLPPDEQLGSIGCYTLEHTCSDSTGTRVQRRDAQGLARLTQFSRLELRGRKKLAERRSLRRFFAQILAHGDSGKVR